MSVAVSQPAVDVVVAVVDIALLIAGVWAVLWAITVPRKPEKWEP
jgi:hypothetical protein